MNDEVEMVRAFFVPSKRERYLEMIAKPKKRQKFLNELCHFKALDPRYRFAVPKVERTTGQIAAFLHRKAAPDLCWVTSENRELDGKRMPLLQALNETLGRQMGTFLSCIPGKLAYFEDEDDRWILERLN